MRGSGLRDPSLAARHTQFAACLPSGLPGRHGRISLVVRRSLLPRASGAQLAADPRLLK